MTMSIINSRLRVFLLKLRRLFTWSYFVRVGLAVAFLLGIVHLVAFLSNSSQDLLSQFESTAIQERIQTGHSMTNLPTFGMYQLVACEYSRLSSTGGETGRGVLPYNRLIRDLWGCAAGRGHIFTAGLTIMGSHFQQRHQNGVTHFRIFWGKTVFHIYGQQTNQNVCTAGEK